MLAFWSLPSTTVPVWTSVSRTPASSAQNLLVLSLTSAASWYCPVGLGAQLTGAGGLLGVLDVVVLGGAEGGGGGGAVVEGGGGGAVVDVAAGALEDVAAGVLEDVVGGVLEDVAGGVLEDVAGGVLEDVAEAVVECAADAEPLAVSTADTADEELMEVSEVAVDESGVAGEELAGGLGEVTKVVGAAAVTASDAGLGTGIAVSGSLLLGMLMA